MPPHPVPSARYLRAGKKRSQAFLSDCFQIHTIAIIAEGIPEAHTRKIIKTADEKGITIIGPATVSLASLPTIFISVSLCSFIGANQPICVCVFVQVGGIKPGCFKIGNTGGMLDNILASKLYRPGSVAYVSRSGGMSNELNNIISRTTDGVFEGVAIGGDRYVDILSAVCRNVGLSWRVIVTVLQIPGLCVHRPCAALPRHSRSEDDRRTGRGEEEIHTRWFLQL